MAIGDRCGAAISFAERDNPIHGTAAVLAALADLKRLDGAEATNAVEWLMTMKHADGSFGGDVGERGHRGAASDRRRDGAMAVEALLTCGRAKAHEGARRTRSRMADRGGRGQLASAKRTRRRVSRQAGILRTDLPNGADGRGASARRFVDQSGRQRSNRSLTNPKYKFIRRKTARLV